MQDKQIHVLCTSTNNHGTVSRERNRLYNVHYMKIKYKKEVQVESDRYNTHTKINTVLQPMSLSYRRVITSRRAKPIVLFKILTFC